MLLAGTVPPLLPKFTLFSMFQITVSSGILDMSDSMEEVRSIRDVIYLPFISTNRLLNHNIFLNLFAVRGNERQKAIDRFETERDSFLFLLSTRAGGVGINLTAAGTSHFVISDVEVAVLPLLTLGFFFLLLAFCHRYLYHL